LLIDVAGSRPSYILGTAEPDVQAFLAEHLRPGDTFFDLGANIGYFSLVGAALVGPTGRVVSFEPSPVNAMALRRNLELNGLVNVEVVEAAVSDTEGVASFDPTDDDQSGRLAEGPASVRTVTIDAEVARTGWSPSLLKVDIEGAEEAALRGMHETLLTHHPVILCEVHALPDLSGPLATSLRDLGYEVRWLEGDIDGTGFWAPHLLAFPS
jgi:FkbM family methyltransferase